METFQTEPEKSGLVKTVMVYLVFSSTTATEELVAGIYLDNNGFPGFLSLKAGLNTLNPGSWNPVTIPEGSITAGQPYWIAVLGPDG